MNTTSCTTAPKRSHVSRKTGLLLLVLSLFVVSLGQSGGTASAAPPVPPLSVTPPTSSGGFQVPPPPAPGGPTAGSGGNSGGCVVAPPQNCGLTQNILQGTSFFPQLPPPAPKPGIPYNGDCAGTTAFGGYIGVNWSFLTTPAGTGQLGVTTTYTCIPPPSFTYRSATCAWAVGAIGDGPSNNPVVGSTRFFTAAPVLSPFAAAGAINPALCTGSFTRTFATATPAAFGIYRLTGTGTQVNCLLREFTAVNQQTGQVPASEFVGCGPQFPVSNMQAAATVYCGGVEAGANTGHSFTPDECKGKGGPGGWSCRVGNPTVDGRNLPLNTIFADGTGHAVAWGGSPGFGGAIRNVRNASSKLTVLPGSTPFRSNEPNPDKQPFAMTPGYGGYQNGFVPEWRTQWFGNSDTIPTVLPWKAVVDYRFLGDFSGLGLKITGVTINPGSAPTIQFGTVPTTYTATATCTGTPVSVVAQRSRNTN